MTQITHDLWTEHASEDDEMHWKEEKNHEKPIPGYSALSVGILRNPSPIKNGVFGGTSLKKLLGFAPS